MQTPIQLDDTLVRTVYSDANLIHKPGHRLAPQPRSVNYLGIRCSRRTDLYKEAAHPEIAQSGDLTLKCRGKSRVLGKEP